MHHLFHVSCLAFAALFFLTSCKDSGPRPDFILTYNVFFPGTHIHARLAREWAEEIGRRSNGRIRIDVYASGLLSSAPETYECVALGVSDLGMSCFSYSRGMFPMIAGLDLPWGYRSGREATVIANHFISHFAPAELQDCKFMYAHAHGPGILAGNRKITSLKQIQGMNIRSTGISAQITRALKANAIGMGQGDTYEALRKGVVDGTLCPVETLKGWRQGEVVNYVTPIPAIGYTTAMFVVMNPRTWAKLPPDLQAVITEVNKEWIPRHGEAWDQADEEGRRMIQDLDKETIPLSSSENIRAAEMMAPLLKAWKDELNRKGLPGDEAFRFMKQELQAAAAAPVPSAKRSQP